MLAEQTMAIFCRFQFQFSQFFSAEAKVHTLLQHEVDDNYYTCNVISSHINYNIFHLYLSNIIITNYTYIKLILILNIMRIEI